jgi:DNA-binding transcriptional MerR regulator
LKVHGDAVKVSELARRAGITPAAVRFYEAEGVLPAAPRTPNGYRAYGESDLCRLRLVVALRGLGLELSESGRLAALCLDGKCDVMEEQLVDRIADRRAAIAQARAELDHLDRELATLERSIHAGRMLPLTCCGPEGGAACSPDVVAIATAIRPAARATAASRSE